MSKLENLKARLSRIRKDGEKTITRLRMGVESVGSAAAAGYARGRFEDPSNSDKYAVFGIDPELVVGAPALLVGMSGILGEASDDVLSVGIGVTGFYAGLMALDMGAKHRKEDVGNARGYMTQGRQRGAMGAGNVSPMAAARAAARAA